MPDSRRLVVALVELSDASELWMGDTKANTLERITAGAGLNDDPSVSPDGRQLLFASYAADWDLVALPLDGSEIQNVLATSRSECCAQLLPGTMKFVYLTNRNGLPEIRLHDQADQSDRVVASTRDFRANATTAKLDMGAPSPDGERLAFLEHSSDGYAIWITLTGGGSPVRLTAAVHPQETAPSWSPDGQWISFLSTEGATSALMRSRVGATDSPQIVLRGTGDDSTIASCIPQWSPTGDWIAFASDSGIAVVNPAGTQRRTLSSPKPVALTWSADGSVIYAISVGSDRRASVTSVNVRMGTSKTIRTFDPGIAFLSPPSFGIRASLAPNGSSILTTLFRTRSDLWILEGFDPPRSFFHTLRAAWPFR
jgi:Tol biopolymer transport system component